MLTAQGYLNPLVSCHSCFCIFCHNQLHHFSMFPPSVCIAVSSTYILLVIHFSVDSIYFPLSLPESYVIHLFDFRRENLYHLNQFEKQAPQKGVSYPQADSIMTSNVSFSELDIDPQNWHVAGKNETNAQLFLRLPLKHISSNEYQ